MKRIICGMICLIVALSFTACNSDAALLRSGNYYAVGDYEEFLTPYLWLDTNEKQFSFCAGSVISYAEFGVYEIIDGKIIATSQSATFEFEIKDKDTLVLTDNDNNEYLKVSANTQFVFSKDLK